MLKQLRNSLQEQADPDKARFLKTFFKTGPGQYGEGDVFLGITVPAQRAIVRDFAALPLGDIQALLNSSLHEERLTALIILVGQFKKADEKGRERIYRFYLKNAARVNNWDLVDSSAHHIVGAHLEGKSHAILKELARSPMLWERRIAMVATFYHIHKGRSEPALSIARMLLKDEEDLMHKAVGWMLREVGKRASLADLEAFLRRHHQEMPRTMLRYAIERFPEAKRKAYLKGLV